MTKHLPMMTNLTITDTAVVINEDSDDVDFRVESNGNANMLVVNAGGDRVGIGSDPDLGAGLHIKTSDTGASAAGGGDELVLENGSANCGLSILTATDGVARIFFSDSGDSGAGGLDYFHDGDHFRIYTAGSERVRFTGTGTVGIGVTSVAGSFLTETRFSGNPGYGMILSNSANVASTEYISFRCNTSQEIGFYKKRWGWRCYSF
jgi:hypothetical protein